MRLILVVPALAATAMASAAQQTPTRTLAKPDVEYAEPFSQIVGVREMRDGRVIVADSRDKALQAIDLTAGRGTPIGREGAGPLEWMTLGRLHALPGDSTAMGDIRNNRLYVIGPDGKPARTSSPTSDQIPAGGGRLVVSGVGPLSARGVDAQGRLYFQGGGMSIGPNGPVPADSVPIIAYDLRTQREDTLAYVRLPQRGPSATTTGPAGGRMTMTAPRPYTLTDGWGVLPDGRVAIAYASDYHLEVVAPGGKRVVGPAVRFTPVRVTDADKKAFLDGQRATASSRQMVINGTAMTPPPPAEPTEWPETKPPFGAAGVTVAPNGDTWIPRSRPATDDIPTIDVFNSQAQLIGRVVLPTGTSVFAFGARAVYLVRTDDDGLQYLQRHAIEWSAPIAR